MPSWSIILPGVVLAGLAMSGVTAASSWWKPNVDAPLPGVASVGTSPTGAVTNVDMADRVGAIERVEDVGTTNAFVAADDPVEIPSQEEPTKSEDLDDAIPDYARADADVDADIGSPAKDCGLDSSKCNRPKKTSSRSSRGSHSEAVPASSEPSYIGLPEVDGVPSNEAFSAIQKPMDADCPVDPTNCNTPKKASDTSGARASVGSTNPAAPEKLSKADIRPGIDAVIDVARACGPKHGAKHDEKVTVDLEFAGASGTVLSAIPRKPHAGTPLGSCVAKALANIKVMEFKRYKQGFVYWIEL